MTAIEFRSSTLIHSQIVNFCQLSLDRNIVPSMIWACKLYLHQFLRSDIWYCDGHASYNSQHVPVSWLVVVGRYWGIPIFARIKKSV
jgi:prepilin-type processing-associated H-X9-DG protein